MARKKRVTKIEEPMSVCPIQHEVDGVRTLVTFGSDAAIWSDLSQYERAGIDGSIVRLIPPIDATDLQIEQVVSLIDDCGAVAVKVLPRQQLGKIGASEESNNQQSIDLREAVIAIAERMASSDKHSLLMELNAVMDEAGL